VGSLYFRDLISGDIDHIAANMREADRQEVVAFRGNTDMRAALGSCVLMSSHYWVAAVGAEPIFVFGVVPVSLLDGMGAPWMLGTDKTFNYPRILVKDGRRYIREMLELYSTLANFVDARNEKSIRWLKRLGFTVYAAEPFGHAGLPFHRFEMKV
jgi:ribosomal protein S18 acetylase RimI-like enzyme